MSNFYNYILASVSFSEVCFFYFHHSDNFLLVGSIFKWENIFSFDVSSFYSVEHDIQTQNLSNYKLWLVLSPTQLTFQLEKFLF